MKQIIIIGAPRSGTNMLRDILCKFGKVGTWPCDEINYIWRHGNIFHKNDEFDKSLAKPKIKNYINKKFNEIATKYNLEYVVEKTCANSLRVPFVDEILPNSIFIFIYRNGIDATYSAFKKQNSKIDIIYILKKLRFVPIFDMPYYAMKFIVYRILKFFPSKRKLMMWGPQFHELDKDLSSHSLIEICALQWKKCVDMSENAFLNINKNRIIRVRYEDFVLEPKKVLEKILRQLDINFIDGEIENAVKFVSKNSVGKGNFRFNKNQKNDIYNVIKDSLNRYGY